MREVAGDGIKSLGARRPDGLADKGGSEEAEMGELRQFGGWWGLKERIAEV